MRERDPSLPARVEGADPRNPLGSRALNLSWQYYRIHGIDNPAKIGRRASNGCFGMLERSMLKVCSEIVDGRHAGRGYLTGFAQYLSPGLWPGLFHVLRHRAHQPPRGLRQGFVHSARQPVVSGNGRLGPAPLSALRHQGPPVFMQARREGRRA